MKRKIYADSNINVNEREKANYSLARAAAAEGIVLLKNDNVLPLKNKNIALYGIGGRKTIKGGTGSGDVNERYNVSIEEGLENSGYTITTKAWLDDYDQEHSQCYSDWRKDVEEKTAGLSPYQVLALAVEQPFRYPSGRLITDEDIQKSETDTAIFVISRQAGEGHDRKLEKGDWYLTDVETENIKKLTEYYPKVIIIINVGGPIDLSILDSAPGIGAIVFYGQGGMEGGNALTDLLSGTTNFSGKLSMSWSKKYFDYPTAKSYSYLNGDLENEYYSEGIYVGYRYFDSYGISPLYPFGYGLSYTDFKIGVENVSLEGSKLSIEIEIKNIGECSGKEVAQMYISCPQGKLPKENKRLIAFCKSNELAPDESETLQICFDLSNAASYDDDQSIWLLESGTYHVYIGNSSVEIKEAAKLKLDSDIILEKCQSCCAPQNIIEEIFPPKHETAHETATTTDNVPVLSINPNEFRTIKNNYSEPLVLESSRVRSLLSVLSPLEMAELLRGGGAQSIGQHNVLGAGGKSAITLADKGIENIIMSDGPAGLNIINEITIDDSGREFPVKVPQRWNIGAMGEMAKKMINTKATPYYRYATAWPVHLVLAQTWNEKLLTKIGNAVGQEMIDFGVTLWLAPGMNIQRNPLCGRNFEYFSEDPLLSGKMAAAITKGVQQFDGIGVTLKHFACNNQEDNRTSVSSNINERALREIYLKGFEIAIKEAEPKAVMTSYNKINHMFTANSHDLCTKLLRCEWGFAGLVMTDWGDKSDPGLCAVAGNDLVMPGTDSDKEAIAKALENGTIKPDMLRRAAARVLECIVNSDIYANKQ